ncbi:MAG: TIGR02996 domain-containing protein, partial [Gemmataceae bacterium]
MLSDDTFLLSILDHPDENAPRLVYADWLEEHGETARAELIRLQCAGQEHERVQELLDRHGLEWAGPELRHVYSCAFRRGCVEEVTVDAGLFLEVGERLFAAAPIRLLRVIGVRAVLGRFVQSPLLARLRGLHLTGCKVGDDGAELLARCEHLRSLRTLRLGENAIGDRGVEALTASRGLHRLSTLVLHGNLIGDLGARLLAACNRLPS